MNINKPSVVFFGSGPVAADSLRLLEENFAIEAIVTKPTTASEMAVTSLEVPLYTVTNKKELEQLLTKHQFTSQLGILIDFGIIVSQQVIDYFQFGIINSHFSLLPEWRGADPITFSILSGQQKTGVSLMLIDAGMDTGKLLTQKTLHIAPATDAHELTRQLIRLSNDLLAGHIPPYLSGTLKPRSQPHPDRATYSRKLTKEDGILDFNKPAVQLEREIRAFIQWPKSRTSLAGKDVVILHAIVDANSSGPIGKAYKTEDKKIGIYTRKGSLIIEALKPAGKNAMSAESFLAGYGSEL